MDLPRRRFLKVALATVAAPALGVTSVKVVYVASSGLTDYAAFFLGPSAFASAGTSSRFSMVM